MNGLYIPQAEYKLLVKCFTFNQVSYIGDALKGFAMQQTDFPFVCLVMDDDSTDGQKEYLKSWIENECDPQHTELMDTELSEIVLSRCKDNGNCTFAFYFLKQNLYGTGKKSPLLNPWLDKCEYLAFCEGDDYWDSPDKLRSQVHFLDSNPEYGMCYTRCRYYYQSENEFKGEPWGGSYETFDQFMRGNTVPTLTAVVRTSLEKRYYAEVHASKQGWGIGDYPRWIFMSHESKVKFFPDVTGVYRVLDSSASHSSNYANQVKFSERMCQIRLFFDSLYSCGKSDAIKCVHHRRLLYLDAVNHRYSMFLKHYFEVLKAYPKEFFDIRIYRYMLYFFSRKKCSVEV